MFESLERSLLDVFQLPKKAIVCIVGAGGKTSLMKILARELKSAGNRVLLSTTTKLSADEISDEFEFLVNVVGEKALSPDMNELKQKTSEYDFILIEADGSAGKPLKGWKETEPVIPEFADITIGVLDISCIGKPVKDSLVHRLDIFNRLTGAPEKIHPDTIAALVNHPDGLFHKSIQTLNMVYLSHVETTQNWLDIEKVCTLIQPGIKVLAGSLKTGRYRQVRG